METTHPSSSTILPPAETSSVVKSSSNTASTCVNSSEEFSLSAELTTASVDINDSTPVLQLSNMSIVEETSQQDELQLTAAAAATQQEPSMSFHEDDDNQSGKVRFAADVTIIKDEDIAVEPTSTKRKKKGKKKGAAKAADDSDNDDNDKPVLPGDIWWSLPELETIERNAMYMVKESQQYQEEVVCNVLYNKAFLSAANLAKSITEDELEARLQNVGDHSNTLVKWTDVGNSRRGLENMVSEKAIENALQSRKIVLQLQQELRHDSAEEAGTCLSQHAEFLAKQSQDATRNARIMARMMGQADADSLATAEALSAESVRLPEPPGRYSGDHECEERVSRSERRTRRGSLIAPLKKAVGNVFRRQGSREVNMRRIRKMQQKQKRMQEEEPPKRPSQEFRRSFLESLDYGEQ